MSEWDARMISVDQLPEDPLKMPPPFWRTSGAIFHIQEAFEELQKLLPVLVDLNTKTNEHLETFFKKYPDFPDENNDEAVEEFAEITTDLFEIDHKIRLKSEIICLMSAIEAEDNLNQFCVYNLHKDIAESIEKLSPPEKLLVASAAIGKASVKHMSAFEAIRKLSAWRNAFVHGHCVDRPTKSLRHNHLIPPPDYPGVPSWIAKMRELIDAFFCLSDYLRIISLNPYTGSASTEVDEIRKFVKTISKYQFDGNNWSYDIIIGQEE